MSNIFINLRKVLILVVITLFIYAIVRVLNISWNWALYSQYSLSQILQAFSWGLRFDICTILLVGLPILLLLGYSSSDFKRYGGTLWFLLQTVFLSFSQTDIELIHFGGRRMTYSSLFLIRELSGKLQSFFTTYAFLTFFNFSTILLFAFLVYKVLKKESKKEVIYPRFIQILGSFILISLYIIGSRGGLQIKPLSIVHSHIFSESPLNILVQNSGFTIIKSLGNESLKSPEYFSDKNEILKRLNGFSNVPSLLDGKRLANQNIVVLIMESFALEYTGLNQNEVSYTPFLDSLAQKSLTFSGIANGRRSIEGIPAILAAIPNLIDEPILASPYASNSWKGLGEFLPKNYTKYFFHGGQNGTMFFDQFAKMIQFDHYYGASEYHDYQKDFDGNWGIYDEPFMQNMILEMKKMPTPFAVTFFSLSSHHPYKLPQGYENKFPKGTLEIHESIGYADYALKRFFEEAQKQPWFENTLFIITADHTQKSDQKKYQTPLGSWQVPILFFHSHFKWPQINSQRITQQVDIVPSILDFLNVTNPSGLLQFGKSIFNPDFSTYAFLYLDQKYILLTENYWIENTGEITHFFDSQSFTPMDVDQPTQKYWIDILKANKQYYSHVLLKNDFFKQE